jgi:rhamnosyltransferase
VSHRTAAIIVTYEPELAALLHLIKALQDQVRSIIVVDNASSNLDLWQPLLPPGATRIVQLLSNEGIAAALNRGFEAAEADCELQFCAIFDQDSEPSADMIVKLESHHDRLAARGPIAQIGPYFFEHNRGYYLPFIEFQYGFPRRKRDPGNGTWTTADYLISSGALISIAALKAIGYMDETLFIDYVDIEWGLRARAAGFQSYGAFDVRMEHTIGEAALSVAGVRLAVHKPLRRYYYYRNALLLCGRSYISLSWKINEICRLGIKFFIFSMLSKRRAADRAMMTRGIRDGLRGKAGKFDGSVPP